MARGLGHYVIEVKEPLAGTVIYGPFLLLVLTAWYYENISFYFNLNLCYNLDFSEYYMKTV